MYKCIRHFHLVGEPTDQWGAPVLQTSSTQGDDVERLHKLRNNISHLPKPILSESEFTEFMSTCFEVALRRDSSLKSPGNRFQAEIREYGTLQIMDSNLEKKYVSLLEENNFLKEQAQQMVGNRKVTIFYGQDVEDKIAGDTSKELSCIVYIYGAHLSDEGMKKTREFFKNLNESILNVKVQRIGTGSIILYVIIYKEAMKDKTCLHNSLCIIMEKMFPFFHDFGRCEKTIQIALYAAQSFFADNASDSLSYLSDESVSFDCKLPRDKIAMNNVLFEYAGNVFMNKTNETETNSASELNVVVTPKNKVIKCQKCLALGDFNYHDDNNYLQIEEGDIIDIIDFEESDWILGQKGNIKGLVPKSHVRLLKHQPDLQTFEVLYDYADDDIEIAQGDIVVSDGIEQNGWLLAQIGHVKGVVPFKYVQRLKNQDENYVKYTEPLSKDKRQTTEHTVTVRPELPKRPPPPSRPPMSKPEDTARIRHDDDTVHMANLYGRREAGELRLVIVGRTGSGKSATGNTIMAKKDHFESKLAGESVTRECKRGECSQSGRKLVVVDTPGLFDIQVPFEHISKEIIRCVNMSTPGPHAFLLVIQIARFTDEEIETLNRLFDLFGENIGKFAIIAFTKLDDLENEETTIENYIEMAPKKMKEFLQRCQGRYIAFDNKASEKKKITKVKSLIQLVDDIGNKNGGKYYTNAMYKEAEAALQRKIKVLEEERAHEKKKEIERIESTFVQKIDSINQENKKLSKQVSSNEVLQRQVRRDKEKALQEIQKMKDKIKKIDKKHNEAKYRVKKQEKQEKEKQAKALEEKEKQNMQIIKDMHQQQMEMNRRYQEMERQKETQLSKASEDHNKRMEAEIQRMVDGSNQKFIDMMKALEAKEKANEKSQEQMTKQNTSIQEMMRDKDKQQDEHNKRLAKEKDRANEYLRRQLDEQKKPMDATKEAILQEQRERDKRQREEFNEATARSNEKMQEQIAQQNASMQTLVLEKDKEILKQQEEHNKRIEEEKARAENTLNVQLADQEKSLNVKTEALLEERRRDKIQRQKDQNALYKINEKILKQNEEMQDLMRKSEREKREQEEKYKKIYEEEKLRARESTRKQQEEQNRYIDKKTEEILRQQRERERRQREEYEELKRQKAKLEEEINNSGCILS